MTYYKPSITETTAATFTPVSATVPRQRGWMCPFNAPFILVQNVNTSGSHVDLRAFGNILPVIMLTLCVTLGNIRLFFHVKVVHLKLNCLNRGSSANFHQRGATDWTWRQSFNLLKQESDYLLFFLTLGHVEAGFGFLQNNEGDFVANAERFSFIFQVNVQQRKTESIWWTRRGRRTGQKCCGQQRCRARNPTSLLL